LEPLTEALMVVRRRVVLEAVVASVPLATLGVAVAGVAGAFASTQLVRRPMRFANLAPELEGLKILQITDLHLGAFRSPSAIPALVELTRAAEPDLLLFTGDICDHLPWLEDALRRFEEVVPQLGAFAVMGNHEHYRGALATRRIYGRTRIEMLDDAHRVLSVRGKKLMLVGVDDPSGWDHAADHYPRRADTALDGAPSDADFRLALCHRPSGFRALAERGIDLTLSGHTHGAQLGMHERSALESLLPDSYLWGRYEHAGKQLYTSSGAGHWAAFRLACPSEAPLIVLERA
jgi:predicted MPP superfamily phosphohydrolase